MKFIDFKQYWETRTEYRLIDVREENEFAETHVRGAELFPLSKIQEGNLPEFDGRALAIICRSGARSQAAGKIFEMKGESCTNIDGGTMAAVASGLDCLG